MMQPTLFSHAWFGPALQNVASADYLHHWSPNHEHKENKSSKPHLSCICHVIPTCFISHKFSSAKSCFFPCTVIPSTHRFHLTIQRYNGHQAPPSSTATLASRQESTGGFQQIKRQWPEALTFCKYNGNLMGIGCSQWKTIEHTIQRLRIN